MLVTNGESWLHDCGPARAFAYILRILMTGGSCVWNRMCITSALVCENGHVLTVKLWFMVLHLYLGLSKGHKKSGQMLLMTGGSCVWNSMCIMSALVCENGHVLTVKLWFMVLNLCPGLSEGH